MKGLGEGVTKFASLLDERYHHILIMNVNNLTHSYIDEVHTLTHRLFLLLSKPFVTKVLISR